jgi:hypothetical protein
MEKWGKVGKSGEFVFGLRVYSRVPPVGSQVPIWSLGMMQ